MLTGKRNLKFSLLTLMVLVAAAAATGLFKITEEIGLRQFNSVAGTISLLIQERISAYFTYENSLIANNSDSGSIAQTVDQIFNDYSEKGILFRNKLDYVFQKPTLDFEPLGISNEHAELSYNLLTEKSIIIASTRESYLGAKLIPDKPENRQNLEEYLDAGGRDTGGFTLLENIDNLWLNLYYIIPVHTLLPESKTPGAYILIIVDHLDKNLLRVTPESSNSGQIHAYNRENELIFSYPERNDEIASENAQRTRLAHNNSNSLLISKPFKNDAGYSVIGGSLWLESMGLGIIIEQPAKKILAPWYLMSSLILIIMLSSFLIFFAVMILLDQKRLEAFDHNPLTHLPGNRRIMDELARAISSKRDYLVIYFDLDNFKAFNDLYGFSAGDDVITYSAALLTRCFKPSRKMFLGHIGGDDFVVIGPMDVVKEACELFGKAFDEEILSFYNAEDRSRGYILSKNRQGESQEFPFMAMSMGGVRLRNHENAHPLRITEICAEVKKKAKQLKGSKLVIDGRISSADQ